MSWLVNSIAKSLKLDEDGDDEDAAEVTASAGDGKQRSPRDDENHGLSPSDDDTLRRGVKEDLSELSKTFTRQLWGVASFLAPSPSDLNPQSLDRSESSDRDDSNSAGIDGIRSDLSEIGGRFRTGISKLSSNKAVSEFSKIASNFLQFVSEEGETLEDYARGGVVGITEEVVAFARDVAMHPETWLDFPLPNGHDEEEDFDMSEIQQEHVFAVERLAPTLAALRMELCPAYMSEGCFWKIYFVLVHPRLTKQDAELLSTSQIVKARAMLTQDLRTNKSIPDGPERSIDTISSEVASSTNKENLTDKSNTNPESVPANISVISLNNSMDTINTMVDKQACKENPVIEEATSDVSKGVDTECDEDGDEWLKEDHPEMDNSRDIEIPIEDGDDVSFSDLEEEDVEIPIKYKNGVSETKDSNEWLDVEDINVA